MSSTRQKRSETTYTILYARGDGSWQVCGEIIAHSPRLARARAAVRLEALTSMTTPVPIVAVPGRSWQPVVMPARAPAEPVAQ
jgi:hypothetical protein